VACVAVFLHHGQRRRGRPVSRAKLKIVQILPDRAPDAASNSYNRPGAGAMRPSTCTGPVGAVGAMRVRSTTSRGTQPRCTSTALPVGQQQRRDDEEAGTAIHQAVVQVDGVVAQPVRPH
jgi:hypothetical protein